MTIVTIAVTLSVLALILNLWVLFRRDNFMKKLENYIENHVWAQLAICAIIVGAFWALAEIGFRLIHGVAL